LRRRTTAGIALCVTATLAVATSLQAGSFFEGRVVRVLDGDTVEVQVGDELRRIRVAGIDAPERAQPWSKRAREALAARVAGKQVRINAIATDRYGRTVGEIYADNACVGCELVRDGHAWAYRGYEPDPVLLELEDQARSARRGLWGLAESERTPPWEWRRARRTSPPAESAPPPRAAGCGDKRRCQQMRDCAEARFYQRECGADQLDGDGDGVPCEALCRE
jgi:micrococcal nuclease